MDGVTDAAFTRLRTRVHRLLDTLVSNEPKDTDRLGLPDTMCTTLGL